ncbi:MAG: hypothetical protein ACOX8U_10340, partial [Bradymonadia bacterium]
MAAFALTILFFTLFAIFVKTLANALLSYFFREGGKSPPSPVPRSKFAVFFIILCDVFAIRASIAQYEKNSEFIAGSQGKFPSQVPHTLKTSSGVFHPKHFRGLLLILFTISSNSLLLRF